MVCALTLLAFLAEDRAEKMEKLGLIVSTTNAQLMANQEFVEQLRTAAIPVVVVNQCQVERIPEDAFPPHVNVINSETKGLSMSRNIAFSLLPCEFAMLCDDDITLFPNALNELIPNLYSGPALFVTPLFTTEGNAWRANYPTKSYSLRGLSVSNRRRIQRINSMEQVISKEYLVKHRLHFDEGFGAGSGGFPMGEETLMAFDVLRTGGSIVYLPIPTRIHPPISTATQLTRSKYLAILAVHRRVYYPFGRFVFAAFYLKKLLQKMMQNNFSLQNGKVTNK